MVPAVLLKVFCATMSATTKPPFVTLVTSSTAGLNDRWISKAASLTTLSALIQTLVVLLPWIEAVDGSTRTIAAPGARVGVAVTDGVLVGIVLRGAGVEVLVGVFVAGAEVDMLVGVLIMGV